MIPSLSLTELTAHIRNTLHSRWAVEAFNKRLVLRKRRQTTNAKLQILYPRRLKRLKAETPIFAAGKTVQPSSTSSSSPSSSSSSSSTSSCSTTTISSATSQGATAVVKKPVSGLDMPVTPNYIAPRAPIALCHGLYGFDKRGPELFPLLQVHYWGGIEEALAKLGAKVIVTRVPRTGSIWERAQELHAILKMVLEGEAVNFIAHSMGGLDCRYLVSHIKNRPYHVQSLTTISTPHRGSPVMDWFRDHVGVGMTDALVDAATRKMETNNTAAKKTAYDEGSIVSARLPLLSWTLADIAKMPSNLLDPVVSKVVQLLDTPAYANLTTDYCKHHFNPNTPDDPNVAYYSYGASTELPVWSFLGLPNQLVKEKEGENDGLVSVESAKWGKYIKTVKADHWDLNGQRYRWRSSKPSDSGFNTVEFYLELATHLYHQGH